jgi:hypothetical protein
VGNWEKFQKPFSALVKLRYRFGEGGARQSELVDKKNPFLFLFASLGLVASLAFCVLLLA